MRNDDKERRGPGSSYGADGKKRSDYTDDGLRPEYNDDSNEIIIGGDKDDIDFDDYARRLERRSARARRKATPTIEYQDDGQEDVRDRRLAARKKHAEEALAEAAGDEFVIGADNDAPAADADADIRRTDAAQGRAAAARRRRPSIERIDTSVSSDGSVGTDDVIEVIAEVADAGRDAATGAGIAAGSVVTIEETFDDEAESFAAAAAARSDDEDDLLEAAADKAAEVKEAVAEKAADIGDAIGEAVEEKAEAVAEKAAEVKEAVAEKAADIGDSIGGAVEEKAEAVAEKAADIKEAVAEKAADISDAISEAVEEKAEAVAEKAADIKEAVADKLSDIGGAIKDKVSDAGAAVAGTAAELIDALTDGASSAAKTGAAQAAAAAASTAAAREPDEETVSRAAEEDVDVLAALLSDDSASGSFNYYDDDEDDEPYEEDSSLIDDFFDDGQAPDEDDEDEEDYDDEDDEDEDESDEDYDEEEESDEDYEDEEESDEDYGEEDESDEDYEDEEESDEDYEDDEEKSDEDYEDDEEKSDEDYEDEEESDEDYDEEDYEDDVEKSDEDYEDEEDYGEEEYGEDAGELFNPTGDGLDVNGLPIPVVKPRNLDAVRKARAAAGESDKDTAFRKEFLVSASPHIHCGETTRVIMGDVVIALIPALIASVLWFGWRALMLTIVCVVSCVVTEFVCRRVMKRRQTVGDLSAVVTGMLLAFCLPPELNPVFAVIGSVVAIAVVKQMFGGIGHNFANPAATARIVMMLSFPAAMTTWSRPFYYYLDAISEATPLSKLSDPAAALPTYTELLVGYHSGCIGETCAIALLLGGAYLLLRGVISWEIPVSFMGMVVIFSLIAGQDPIYQLLSGGVMLGALFMATDYVTSPVNRKGRLIFGAGCGLLTMLIRLYGNMPEGVSFAILLMNILTPHIDRLTLSVPFGEERERA